MRYTKVALEEKIIGMYPEILHHNISVSLDFNRKKNTYIVKLKIDNRIP